MKRLIVVIFYMLFLFVSVSETVISQESISQIDMGWHESLKNYIDEAIDLYTNDPVSSLLTFKYIFEHRSDDLNTEQKVWLENQIDSLQLKALTVLKKDYDIATEMLNLRDMFLVSIVANEISEDWIKVEPSLSEVRNKVYTNAKDATYTFKITDATGEIINESYSDGIYNYDRITISPGEDYQILRVKANIENINSEKDKSYALFTLEDFKRLSTPIYVSAYKEITEAYKWLDDSFIFLLLPDYMQYVVFMYVKAQDFAIRWHHLEETTVQQEILMPHIH